LGKKTISGEEMEGGTKLGKKGNSRGKAGFCPLRRKGRKRLEGGQRDSDLGYPPFQKRKRNPLPKGKGQFGWVSRRRGVLTQSRGELNWKKDFPHEWDFKRIRIWVLSVIS